MVSAVAPHAHILLVEADDTSFDNLGAAVDEAVALGAKYVSNSYGTGYTSTRQRRGPVRDRPTLDPHYNHPGVAVVASSGDGGYGVSYPAASQYVTSVGGTSLVADTAAPAAGPRRSGTTLGGPGQRLLALRAQAGLPDTTPAAPTAPSPTSPRSPTRTPASRSTRPTATAAGRVYGGTSAASPIIAGVYADAGTPAAGTYPNAYPYAATAPGSTT